MKCGMLYLKTVPGPPTMFVYYETRKRELHERLTYECRCDERLKTEGSTYLVDNTNFEGTFLKIFSIFCFWDDFITV